MAAVTKFGTSKLRIDKSSQ